MTTIMMSTYRRSPQQKLAQEPNPFDSSFASVATTTSPTQPLISSVPYYTHPPQLNSQSLSHIHPPPLAAAITTAPNAYPALLNSVPITYQQPQQPIMMSQTVLPPPLSNPWGNMSYPQQYPSRKGVGGRKRKPTEGMDQKKIQFLERNRQAALKCRLRKKKRVENTQLKRTVLEQENFRLETMIADLQLQCNQLNSMLQSHRNCSVYQQSTVYHPPPSAPSLVRSFPLN